MKSSRTDTITIEFERDEALAVERWLEANWEGLGPVDDLIEALKAQLLDSES